MQWPGDKKMRLERKVEDKSLKSFVGMENRLYLFAMLRLLYY